MLVGSALRLHPRPFVCRDLSPSQDLALLTRTRWTSRRKNSYQLFLLSSPTASHPEKLMVDIGK